MADRLKGVNLHGVEAASRTYFGKSAADLSLGEAAPLPGTQIAAVAIRID